MNTWKSKSLLGEFLLIFEPNWSIIYIAYVISSNLNYIYLIILLLT